MKKTILIFTAVFLSTLLLSSFQKGTSEPWKPEQLMEPSALAAIISDPKAVQPIVINIGPAGQIKGSIAIGATNDSENLKSLKDLLSRESKDREIIIYCGCCPFKNCPNIRPAFSLLNKMKFTRHKLLNLPKNLKADWIDHGYPMNPR